MTRHQRHLRAARTGLSLCALVIAGGCAALDVDGKGAAQIRADTNAAVADNNVALKLAHAAGEAGDLASAVSLYKSIVAANAGDDAVLVELGEAQLGIGAVDDAVQTFSKVGAKSPSQLGAQLGMERAYLMLRDPAKALSYADSAMALAPNDKRVQIARGVALDMLGRHTEAQPCYRKAIAIDPHDIAARSDLALSLALTGGFDEAIAIMTPIARDPSATPRLRQNLALIYGLKGDAPAARTLSRVDLDTTQTDTNLRFFAMVRQDEKAASQAPRPDSTRTR